MKQCTRILTVVTFAVIMASAAYAIDGRIPIHDVTNISQPGHYYLTRDISSTNDPVIDINSNDVTLDLNGHTISSSSTTNIVVDFDEYTNITIKNGRINGGGIGVYYNSTSLKTEAVIGNLQIDGVDNWGIKVYGTENIKITNCVIRNVQNCEAILLNGDSETFTGKIEDNVIDSTGGNSIFLRFAEGMSIRNNNISNAGNDGIFLYASSSLIGGGNIIENNTVTTSADNGMYIYYSDSNIIRNNVCQGNAGNGMYFPNSYRNLIDSNQCEGNGGWGIDAGDTTNNYRNNMLLNNTSGTVTGGTDAGGNIL